LQQKEQMNNCKTFSFTYEQQGDDNMATKAKPMTSDKQNAKNVTNGSKKGMGKRPLNASTESIDDPSESQSKKNKSCDCNTVLLSLEQINKKLDTLTSMQATINQLTVDVDSNKSKIKSINDQLSKNTSTINQVSTKVNVAWQMNEKTEIELRKINLVFAGIPEDENESENALKVELHKIIKKITNKDIHVDTANRIGQKRHDRTRLVKTRFYCLSDREMVWSNRLKTTRPVFINEDLPPTTLKAHAIMRKKLKELKTDSINAKPNFYKKTITTDEKFYFFDENLVLQENVIENEEMDADFLEVNN